MLLTTRRSFVASLHRPVQGAALAVAALVFSRYPIQAARPDQQSMVASPNTGRPQPGRGGIVATQRDFGSVDNRQDPQQPIFYRYVAPQPVQRLVRPTITRYPNLYAGWVYPSFITTGNVGRPQLNRGGIPATQTDFAIRRPAFTGGLRWNGLTLGYGAVLIAKAQPTPWATYFQPLGMPTVDGGGSVFPTQYAGLRVFYHGAVNDLCLVALADAPIGVGGQIRIDKNGTLYAVYLVDIADPNATPIRLKTTTGTLAIRAKT